jgi:hypothetical protein
MAAGICMAGICQLFPFRFPACQYLSELSLEFGSPFLERTIKELVPLINVAIFENAFR